MLKRIFLSRWFFSLIGFLILAVVIFIAGPLFAFADYRPLASYSARLITIGIVGLLILLPWLLKQMRAGLGARKLLASLKSMAKKSPEAPQHSNVERMAEGFGHAINQLKKRSFKGNLYQLPWYMIIGPPGAGKTTAISESGLEFPLADRIGTRSVDGVGGTRNCKWWFTNTAVLIDTAGRYVSQDSDQPADEAEWHRFLELLRQHRRHQPINGVIIAVSLTEILDASHEDRLRTSMAIKQRLAELEEKFKIRFPVYLMVTKCDMLDGFVEFFENFGQQEVEQVWGMTFEHAPDEDQPLKDFERRFDELVRQLNVRVLTKLDAEPELTRRQKIMSFPRQFALQRDMLRSFLHDVFEDPLQLGQPPLVRGIYFTSGTQTGTPLDRLLGSLAAHFQFERQSSDSGFGKVKSYFLHDLLTKVIFQEAGLVTANRQLEQRIKLLNNLAYASIAGLTILALILFVVSYRGNLGYIENVRVAVADLDNELDLKMNHTAPVIARNTLLTQARNLPGGYADQERGTIPWTMNLGLYQGHKLGEQSLLLYHRLQQNLLLPPLIQHVENMLRDQQQPAGYFYPALKTYLMLGSSEHYEREAMQSFIEWAWLPKVMGSADDRHAFLEHITAFLRTYDPSQLPLQLDSNLIREVRRHLTQTPMDEWLYSGVRQILQYEMQGEPEFSIYHAAGGIDASRVFVRKSGSSLRDGIPALFTKNGYDKFEAQSPVEARILLEQRGWVLGDENIDYGHSPGVIEGRLKQLYLVEYAKRYRTLLNDVTLVPFGPPQEAARMLSVLSNGENSPLVKLLHSVRKETQFKLSGMRGRVEEAKEKFEDFFPLTQTPPPVDLDPVSETFTPLHALVDQQGDRPPGINQVLDVIKQLHDFIQLLALETSAGGSVAPHVIENGRSVVQQLKIEAVKQPRLLVGHILNTAGEQAKDIAYGRLLSHINEVWKGQPREFCRDAIIGRYPISRQSSQNVVRLEDFGRFFGYGGIMETFFNEHLRPYVDTSARPWKNQQTGTESLQLSKNGLLVFERADTVKRTFFPHGQNNPTVSFGLMPVNLDKRISISKLNLHGTELRYEHGPQRLYSLAWPGQTGNAEVSLKLQPHKGREVSRSERGPWAWFRIMENNALIENREGRERFSLQFNIDGYVMEYELTARSAYNPFHLQALTNFDCPEGI